MGKGSFDEMRGHVQVLSDGLMDNYKKIVLGAIATAGNQQLVDRLLQDKSFRPVMNEDGTLKEFRFSRGYVPAQFANIMVGVKNNVNQILRGKPVAVFAVNDS